MVGIFISLIVILYASFVNASPCPLNELYKDTVNVRHIDWTFLKSDGAQATTSTGKKIALSYYDSATPEFKWWTGSAWSTASSESANKLAMSQKSSSGEFYYLLPTSTTFWNSLSDKIVDIRFVDDSADGAMATSCQVYIQPSNRFNDTTDAVTVGAINTDVITNASLATTAVDEITDSVWAENINTYTGNSAGHRLRGLAGLITESGTILTDGGVGSNWVTLSAGSASDGVYEEQLLVIYDGTGAGQAHHIVHYEGATKKAWVDDNWELDLNTTSAFVLVGGSAHDTMAEGKITSAASNTAVLEATESTVDDVFNDHIIYITSGTGRGQISRIVDYVGSTKTITVSPAWQIAIPDANSGYYIYGQGQVNLADDAITAAKIQDGAVTDAKITKIRCDVTVPSTSGTSFTIAACTDAQGNAIAIAANKFVGDRIEAYTNGGTTCNVNGQTGVITAMNGSGVVTLQNTTPPNQAFTAAPNTTNCWVIIK